MAAAAAAAALCCRSFAQGIKTLMLFFSSLFALKAIKTRQGWEFVKREGRLHNYILAELKLVGLPAPDPARQRPHPRRRG